MTGTELSAIRHRLRMTHEEFGARLGYKGLNIRRQIRRMEHGERFIGHVIAAKARQMLENANEQCPSR